MFLARDNRHAAAAAHTVDSRPNLETLLGQQQQLAHGTKQVCHEEAARKRRRRKAPRSDMGWGNGASLKSAGDEKTQKMEGNWAGGDRKERHDDWQRARERAAGDGEKGGC